ncbi:MAG: 5'-methylthioadenosine/adenosylhomocysteine nucleosidase [Methanobacteriaceae archaeon]|nr:5'-methylthioadenosine/adenosylhomocysteine nucleosidase [Methanobacteriaceae archaeon]
MNYKKIILSLFIVLMLSLSLSSVSAADNSIFNDNQNIDVLFNYLSSFHYDGNVVTGERYAIIAALDFEVELLKNELVNMEEIDIIGTPAYKGTIGNHEVIVMQCGMGKVSAADGTQALIDKFHPDYIINTGCAGGIGKGLSIGDIVVSDSVIEWDLDLRQLGYPLGYVDSLGIVEMKADKGLSDKMVKSIPSNEHVVRGLVVSGDQFVSTEDQMDQILTYFPKALCTEMEGASVGHVCTQNNVPFCVIRSISDTADSESDVDYASFSKMASEKSASWIIKMLKTN